jgi:hypothetical protein
MTYSPNVQAGAPLGVGKIVGDSFSILMRHFVTVVMLAVVPTLIGLVVSGMLNGWGVAVGTTQPVFNNGAQVTGFVLAIIVQIMAYGVTTALLVQAAYDAKLDRPLTPGRYMGPAMRAALPIAILSLVAGILTGIAALALVIPGLWVYAVFSVMPAAVMIEKVGFGGLGRSSALTKEYRWPILGAIILVGIVNWLINVAAVFVVGLVGGGSVVVAVLVLSVLSAIGAALGSIAVALIYARLREIKEGTSVRDIASVFD